MGQKMSRAQVYGVLLGVVVLLFAIAANAKEPSFQQIPKVKKELAEKAQALAHEITIGMGKTDILFISDPFCDFCRMAYDDITNKKKVVRKLFVVHVPMRAHPGADMACALAAYLTKKGNALNGLDMAYRADIPMTGNHAEARAFLFKQFQYAFPGELSAFTQEAFMAQCFPEIEQKAKAARNLGFKSAPIIIANGRILNGYEPSWLNALLTPASH